jgi:sulfite reductase (NADPH) flavoprotein alpha-component
MGFRPRLPDTAPFSPNQRAWLDGYIAGWFSLGPDTVGQRPVPETPMATTGAEDFPWHDPTLSLEERLALAEGRRPERVLMAAMAQLDCGQCGYLCQTYAEAIARGEEKSLTRCIPGGKATSRKLKQLIEAGLNKPTVASPSAARAASAPLSTASPPADRPFAAEFRGADCLNRAGSEKETRHVVFAAEDGVANYEVGDSLGVFARNSAELVCRRKIEMTPGVQSRNDTPVGGRTRPARH